ncbi:MAG: S8 family serine peptidase [Bacteriovoracaceae bacterium]
MKATYFLALIFLFLSASCGAENHQWQYASPNANRFICANKDDFTCLKRACSFVQGNYNQKSNTCNCQEGHAFTIKESQPACVQIKTEAFTHRGDQVYFIGEQDDESRYIQFRDRAKVVTNLNSEDKNNLLIKFGVPIQAPGYSHEKVLFKDKLSSSDIALQLKDLEIPLSPQEPEAQIKFKMFYYQAHANDIHHLDLNHKVQLDQKLKQELGADTYQQLLTKKFISDTYSQRGCLELCTRYKSIQVGHNTVTWKQTHTWGVLTVNVIEVFKKSYGSVEKTYFLYPSNKLSHYIKSSLDEAGNFKASAYSHNKRMLGEYSSNFLGDLRDEQDLADRTWKNQSLGGVVLCDTGFLPSNLTYNQKRRIIKGEGKGYWGVGFTHSQKDLFAGTHTLSQRGIPQYPGSGHAELISKNLTDVNIMPMTIDSCFKEFKNWHKTARKHNAKVVNLSFANSRGQSFCKEASLFNNTKNEFLWVTGAGNDNLNAETQNISYCPQGALAGIDNGIVVGFVSSDWNRSNSNYGESLVDIYVWEDSTSQAATVVSNLAAKLIHKYKLSPYNAKRAIMLGAEREWNWKVKHSKSKGVINPKNAEKLAKELRYKPTLSDEKLKRRLNSWF